MHVIPVIASVNHTVKQVVGHVLMDAMADVTTHVSTSVKGWL